MELNPLGDIFLEKYMAVEQLEQLIDLKEGLVLETTLKTEKDGKRAEEHFFMEVLNIDEGNGLVQLADGRRKYDLLLEEVRNGRAGCFIFDKRPIDLTAGDVAWGEKWFDRELKLG